MNSINRRRWCSRWRMLLNLVIVSGLIRHCKSMSIKKLGDSFPSPPAQARSSSETKHQNLDSPSDLAWQAWLLLDSQSGAHSGFDSTTFLRRITPKSVFIAPALPACAEGYRADSMGRCVKGVNIDHEAHYGFLLQQLNNLYGNRGANSGALQSSSLKKSSGPFQLNIPLLSDVGSHSSKVDHEDTKDSMKIPVVVAPQTVIFNEKKRPPVSSMMNDQAKNNQTSDSPSSTNQTSSPKDDTNVPMKHDMAIPVEFVDDSEEANFSEVIDYKIPIDLKLFLNTSNSKPINVSKDQDAWKNESQLYNSTEPESIFHPPAAILPYAIAADFESEQLNNTDRYTIVQGTNLMENVTDKQAIGANTSEPVSTEKEYDVPLTVVDKDENDTLSGSMLEIRNSEDRDEMVYEENDEEDDYIDSTEFPDEDPGAEGGEILKHGEAGMPIPVKNIERFQMEKRREEMERRKGMKKNETSSFDLFDDVSVRRNDSKVVKMEEKEESGSNVSSEVSITGDIILETTLLDVVIDKTQNYTKSAEASSTTSVESSDEDLKDLFEPDRKSSSETDVLFSPQNVYNTVSTNLQGSEQTERIDTQSLVDLKSDELEAASSSSETLLYSTGSKDQYRDKNPMAKIHTIDDQPIDGKETVSKKSKDSNSFRTYESETLNFRPTPEYNRYSTSSRQPVRFPLEEANSIHNQNYKEKVPYTLDDGLHSSTKSSIFTYQKSFRRGWRTSRQQTAGKQMEGTVSNQRQRPMSISFWTSVPFMRDPSLYANDQNSHTKTTNSEQYINNRFPEVSPS